MIWFPSIDYSRPKLTRLIANHWHLNTNQQLSSAGWRTNEERRGQLVHLTISQYINLYIYTSGWDKQLIFFVIISQSCTNCSKCRKQCNWYQTVALVSSRRWLFLETFLMLKSNCSHVFNQPPWSRSVRTITIAFTCASRRNGTWILKSEKKITRLARSPPYPFFFFIDYIIIHL